MTIPIGTPLAEADDRIVTETLNLCEGDKEKAAKLLGILATLYRRFPKKAAGADAAGPAATPHWG